jgi:hypothetical protein
MGWESVFVFVCGYEQVDGQLRLYVESANPQPSFDRQQGMRSPLFRLYTGGDAESILAWLDRHRTAQCLRVPPEYRPEWGARAVLLASDWHCGAASALFRFAETRTIHDDDHRLRLQREVRLLIASVLENPVRPGEFEDLQFLEDTVNSASVGVELATPVQIVDAFFGTSG